MHNELNEKWNKVTPEYRELAQWVMNLTPKDLPSTPFKVHPAITIKNKDKYLSVIQGDVQAGPDGPRGRYGVLEQDLVNLKLACENIQS